MRIVIVGGGLAAASAAGELRERDPDSDVVIIAAEPHLPYERPPLSKEVLLGSKEAESATLHDKEWYAERRIDVRLGEAVTGIDLDRQQVRTDAGATEAYDRLILATGSRPRRLPVVDDSGATAAYLRTIEDAVALKASLTGSIVIIGGGWIGLEVASAARQAGAEVTIIETLDLPLLNALGPRVARSFADLHAAHGVDLRLGARITGVDADGTVHLEGGDAISSDLIVVGVGAEPVDEVAREAGLVCENGVLVNEFLRASDPHVFAIGDVANHDHPVLGRRIRVEHWDTAIQQGRSAARTVLGADDPYVAQPYFFTDQYDVGIEYVGSVPRDFVHDGGEPGESSDEVIVRGDEAGRAFVALWVRDGHVLAGMHVNDWDAINSIRSVVGQRIDVARARDSSLPLEDALVS